MSFLALQKRKKAPIREIRSSKSLARPVANTGRNFPCLRLNWYNTPVAQRKPTELTNKFLEITDPKRVVGLWSCYVKWVFFAVAVLVLSPLRGVETNGYYKSFGEWANAHCPLGVWRFVESNGTERSFLVCPKTSRVYEIVHGHVDARKCVEVNPLAFAKMYVPTNSILGVATTDMVGFINIQLKQGETTFGYPYDVGFLRGFEDADILSNPFDGDFVSYAVTGQQYSACATFAPDGKSIRWHHPQSFELLKGLPCPDADKEISYFRRQGTNTSVSVSGMIRLKGPSVYSYLEYGIEEANRLANGRPIARAEWQKSLLGGYINWTGTFPKTSIRDPRRFYVRLKDGRKAFAMIQDDHRHLMSPITHALLTVPRSAIVDFEPILDGAYSEKDCFSASEVESLYDDYNDPAPSRWWWLLGLVPIQIIGLMINSAIEKTVGILRRYRFVLFWLNVLVVAAIVIWCACGNSDAVRCP